MKYLLIVIAVICLICLSVWWNIYAYQDCKKVGHSTLYCIGRIGK